jgi:nucleotide-binding universal stress UspA family protein
MTNLALLHSGSSEEAPAVSFTIGLAKLLRLKAESRYMPSIRAVIGVEQWREYQSVVGSEGFAKARPIFDEVFQTLLSHRLGDAAVELSKVPGADMLVRGRPIELLHTPESELSTLGFTHDLLLASFDADPVIPELLIRQTLVRGGGPIALIKACQAGRDLSESTMLVAWKPLMASKRAIQSALPILRAVKRVYLVSAEEYGEPPMNPDAATMARYLNTCHQIPAEAQLLQPADSPALQLAEFYRETRADLLVMGGYSHSRLQELFFGGFTQYFTEKQCCNLYLVH